MSKLSHKLVLVASDLTDKIAADAETRVHCLAPKLVLETSNYDFDDESHDPSSETSGWVAKPIFVTCEDGGAGVVDGPPPDWPDWAPCVDFQPTDGIYPVIDLARIDGPVDVGRLPTHDRQQCGNAWWSDSCSETALRATRDRLLMGGADVALYEGTCLSCYLEAALNAFLFMKAYHEEAKRRHPDPGHKD